MNLTKLDKAFSEFIRLRDSNVNGHGKCISCGKVLHWKNAHCGHYISRRKYAVRYNEKNCNLQCVSCNTFQEGNPAGYTLGLVRKYGKDIINDLLMASKLPTKWTQWELDELTKFYKSEVKKLINETK
ncbi:MAG TPA: recombination protein NinG [Bacteroidales bacterium]|nr:recombination protein NinG [Bacteroidales bacterium]